MKTFLLSLLLFARRRPLVTAINEEPALTRFINAINVAIDGEGDWFKIKYGVYPNKVGLQVFDREAADRMVTAFNSLTERYARLFRGQPIYVGHPDDAEWKRQNPNIPEEAVGRITELKAEEDGMLLRRAFNDQGKRLTAGEAPAYTAFSPNWGMVETTHQGRKAYRPVYLFSLGLCNRPQISGTFIGLNEALPHETTNPPMNKKLIELLAALGITLAADATDAQATTAINEALPKAATAVADQGKLATAINEKATLQTQLTAAQGSLTTATNEAATLRTSLATERAARADVLLVTAVNEGRITEAQKPEWMGKFTAANADFTAVAGELGKLKVGINTKSKSDDLGGRRASPPSKITTAVNEAVSTYLKDHPGVSRPDAFNAVRLDPKHAALFTNDKAE